MKTNKKWTLAGLMAISMVFFSFSAGKGGDSFQVYLNGKMMLQQYVHADKSVKRLELTSSSVNDKLDVYYYHCGQLGKNRYITITDGNNHSLHVWKYEDGNPAMSFTLKDVTSFLKNNDNQFGISYSSAELPKGKTLATVYLGNSGIVKK